MMRAKKYTAFFALWEAESRPNMKKILFCFVTIVLILCGCQQQKAEVATPKAESEQVAIAPIVTTAPQGTAQQSAVVQSPAPKKAPIEKQTTAPKPAATIAPTSQPPAKEQSPEKAQTVSVTAKDDEGNFILGPVQISYIEGMTAFDALKNAGSVAGVAIHAKGIKSMIYVEGIGSLFEFDKGSKSGWLYSVNGGTPGKSAGSVKIGAQDVVLWRYTVSGK